MKLKFKINSKKRIFLANIAIFFLALAFQCVSACLLPLNCVDNWSFYDTMDRVLDSGTAYAVGEAQASNWPNNCISQEEVSYHYLQQAYKWSGIGFHTLKGEEESGISFALESLTFSSVLIENDEWQQNGMDIKTSILEGLVSTNADGWNKLLSQNSSSDNPLFLPVNLGDVLSKKLGYKSRDELIGKECSTTSTFISGMETPLIIQGFFNIKTEYSSYYQYLFGDQYVISSTNFFSKIKGTKLLFQFSSARPKGNNRRFFFELINEKYLKKSFKIDFNFSPEETSRIQLQQAYNSVQSYPQMARFFSLVLIIIFSVLAILTFSLYEKSQARGRNFTGKFSRWVGQFMPFINFPLMWLCQSILRNQTPYSAFNVRILWVTNASVAYQYIFTLVISIVPFLIFYVYKLAEMNKGMVVPLKAKHDSSKPF